MSRALKRIIVAAGMIRAPAGHQEAGKYLMTRRREGVHLAGEWEFPGGKVEPGESPLDALHREIIEELAVEVAHPHPYAIGHHAYPDKEVILLIYRCELSAGEPVLQDAAELRWLSPEELLELPLPPADAPALERLRGELNTSGSDS